MDQEKEDVVLRPVSQTAILTLRARADEHDRADRLFADPVAVDWFHRLSWPTALDEWYANNAQNNIALRVDDIDHLLRRYCAVHGAPRTVVELGCGFSTRSQRLTTHGAGFQAAGEGTAGQQPPGEQHADEEASVKPAPGERQADKEAPIEPDSGERAMPMPSAVDLHGVEWVTVDLPAVIAQRAAWGAAEVGLADSVTGKGWLSSLPPGPDYAFVAEGLLYYLPREEVDVLFDRLRERFAGAVLIMDVLGPNEYPALRAQTEALNTPIQWCFDRTFDEVFDDFGLTPVPGFEPSHIMKDAIQRYARRVHPIVRIARYWQLPYRSGNILGRL